MVPVYPSFVIQWTHTWKSCYWMTTKTTKTGGRRDSLASVIAGSSGKVSLHSWFTVPSSRWSCTCLCCLEWQACFYLLRAGYLTLFEKTGNVSAVYKEFRNFDDHLAKLARNSLRRGNGFLKVSSDPCRCFFCPLRHNNADLCFVISNRWKENSDLGSRETVGAAVP